MKAQVMFRNIKFTAKHVIIPKKSSKKELQGIPILPEIIYLFNAFTDIFIRYVKMFSAEFVTGYFQEALKITNQS